MKPNSELLSKLRQMLPEGKAIIERDFDVIQARRWDDIVEGYVRSLDPLSDEYDRGTDYGLWSSAGWFRGNHPKGQEQVKAVFRQRVAVLEAILSSEPRHPFPTAVGRKVFLVHGHDDGVLHRTARYLESLNFDPVILHEQPNAGRTIIEKFVDYADVGFAVVLLTPDDQGGLASAPIGEQKPRARQNVILELGYFLGKLGRSRVCALYLQGVEIPSDYTGVLFVPFDESGGWQLTLTRELKAAGFAVDMNRAV